MRTLIFLGLLAGLFRGESKALEASATVAVLPWANHADAQFDDFVRGVPDMVMTNLSRSGALRVIERPQITSAFDHFRIEESGAISDNDAKTLGTWLGADCLLMGSFARAGRTLRMDVRLIDARTGLLKAAESIAGEDVRAIPLVDGLCEKILARLSPATVPERAERRADTGRLKVTYKMFFSLLTSRPLYHQRCKVFVDDKLLSLTPVIDKEDRVFELMDTTLSPGSHVVTLTHFYVDEKGGLAQEMDGQPEPFFVNIVSNTCHEISYRCKIGVDHEEFEREGKMKMIRLF